MKNFKSKANKVFNKFFPEEKSESIEESIYKNSLDSKAFFNVQRLLLEKEVSKEVKVSPTSSKAITLSEELSLNKFKEIISSKEKILDARKLGIYEFESPNYIEIVKEQEEELKAKKNKEIAEAKDQSKCNKKSKNKSKRRVPLLNNWTVREDVIENTLIYHLKKAKVNSIIILSDDAYTRQLVGYRKLIAALQREELDFYEYTNVRPNLTRSSISQIVDFAYKHRANCVLVVGSNSLIDLSKLVIKKLIKPNSIRIQSNSHKPVVSAYYSIFSIPTLVIPSPKLVEKHILSNKPIFKNLSYFDQSIYLFNPIDSSDHVFYYPNFLVEYPKSKKLELLHLLFFKLFFYYFDSELNVEERMRLIREIKSVDWYLNYVRNNSDLSLMDCKLIMDIAAKCYDGRYFMTKSNYWTWYKLAANLTHLTNIHFYESLSLFLPSFIEYITLNDKEGHDRALEISCLLYGSVSAEGLIMHLIQHIKKFNLPTKFFDIPSLKEIDSKFINLLIKQASPLLSSYKMSKMIIQNLAAW
ncbi:iron-containing alcohol dehydrogenase [Mycoplasma parvum]|uniref:Alcohol dehydrogenase n=1 Tax=Mycoplasma parvum str. Indiana TaxID=1403316 RepID=U5NBQ0_9MOLU|nr:iron-containing alcohol dehydrogenase [Mycoplasma parvum]AGX88986.1 alcohol dehydrogenase [Mycoplasma parvum str. Indiana]